MKPCMRSHFSNLANSGCSMEHLQRDLVIAMAHLYLVPRNEQASRTSQKLILATIYSMMEFKHSFQLKVVTCLGAANQNA